MKTRLTITAAALAALTLLPMAGAHAAPQKTVCPNGCDYSSIQAAIDAASDGATITIAPGKYVENLTVTHSVTLAGSGEGTVLYPAASNPNCDGNGGGSLCADGSNMILVQANDVTISNLRLEGDNPNLHSGVSVDGADLDARNGIITDHNSGRFDNLTVSHVTVSDIYLRGIYASSGGTFEFDHNTVDNVQADPASIAMFNWVGSGVMADNKVTNANDAISANHSTGTRFLHNDVSKSASGVHTDNNGDSGGSADLIQGNTVHDCTTDGYGVWVFVPYMSPTVDSNTVKGCAVGLAAFASGVPGAGAIFTNNVVKQDGAKTTDPAGTYGAYLTTDMLGWGTGDLTATLTGNTFEHFDTGVFVTDQPGNDAHVTVSPNNSFHDNGTGLDAETSTLNTVNATSNWWGCKQGAQDGGGCDTATGNVDSSNPLTKKP